jgi:hypothetical protein
MKLVKFTNSFNNKPLYINIFQIGSVSETERGGTKITSTTHNNGGFTVVESVQYVINQIEHYMKNNN